MTRDELKSRLSGLGASPQDLDLMIQDVEKMITATIFIRFVPELTSELQEKCKGQTPDQLLEYLKEHPTEFPSLSAEQIQKIEKETWDRYFIAMEKVSV